jgi:hypothetical protein
MKKAILAGVLLAAGLVTAAAQQQREVFEGTFGWTLYSKRDSTIQVRDAGDGGAIFSGMVSREGPRGEEGGAGYVIESSEPTGLGLDGMRRIIIEVSGISSDTDRFDMGKLLKLELNNRPRRTHNNIGTNLNDRDFINARNGEYIFDIADLGTIRKINIVFYNCTVGALKLKMFVE